MFGLLSYLDEGSQSFTKKRVFTFEMLHYWFFTGFSNHDFLTVSARRSYSVELDYGHVTSKQPGVADKLGQRYLP